jgi:hypothetical protein
MDPIESVELPAGPDQAVVVYQPSDLSMELQPVAIFGEVARDAARRAGQGEWIVSLAVMPLRHAGTAFGQEGSGYETKTAVAVVYGRLGKGAPATDR